MHTHNEEGSSTRKPVITQEKPLKHHQGRCARFIFAFLVKRDRVAHYLFPLGNGCVCVCVCVCACVHFFVIVIFVFFSFLLLLLLSFSAFQVYFVKTGPFVRPSRVLYSVCCGIVASLRETFGSPTAWPPAAAHTAPMPLCFPQAPRRRVSRSLMKLTPPERPTSVQKRVGAGCGSLV